MLVRHLVLFLWVLALSLYASLTHAALDAVFANSLEQPNWICLGDGMGGFTCSDVSADTNFSQGVALGDVNGDTALDAVFANSFDPNRICLGDGMGGFTCSDVSTNIDLSEDVALGDVNGDALLDAIFANSPFLDELPGTNRVCLGDGVGGFTCSDVSADTNSSRGVALEDVNGDTFLDVVFANSADSNRVCLGDGMGGFTCSDVSADSNSSLGVSLGDVNGDTFLDAVFANSPSLLDELPGTNQVCLGDGMGGFTCSDVSADTNSSRGVALGDVNGDTFLDAIFANSPSLLDELPGTNRVCLGDGVGGFTCSDVSADSNNSYGVALGNVNGDTSLDAVFANFGSSSSSPDGFTITAEPNRICLGDGTGGFSCSDVGAGTNFSSSVALGEVDRAEVDKPVVISPTAIPTLSLWAWFLLSILLAGMATIMLRTVR